MILWAGKTSLSMPWPEESVTSQKADGSRGMTVRTPLGRPFWPRRLLKLLEKCWPNSSQRRHSRSEEEPMMAGEAVNLSSSKEKWINGCERQWASSGRHIEIEKAAKQKYDQYQANLFDGSVLEDDLNA